MDANLPFPERITISSIFKNRIASLLGNNNIIVFDDYIWLNLTIYLVKVYEYDIGLTRIFQFDWLKETLKEVKL